MSPCTTTRTCTSTSERLTVLRSARTASYKSCCWRRRASPSAPTKERAKVQWLVGLRGQKMVGRFAPHTGTAAAQAGPRPLFRVGAAGVVAVRRVWCARVCSGGGHAHTIPYSTLPYPPTAHPAVFHPPAILCCRSAMAASRSATSSSAARCCAATAAASVANRPFSRSRPRMVCAYVCVCA